jgi:hypothetical protein
MVKVADGEISELKLQSNALPTLATAATRKMPPPAAPARPPTGTPRSAQTTSDAKSPAASRVRPAQYVPPQRPPSPFVEEVILPGEELPAGPMIEREWAPPESVMAYDGSAGCGDTVGGDWMPPAFGPHGRPGGPLERAIHGLVNCVYGPPCYEGSLGVERVMHAPFFIDTTQPMKNCRVRFDFAWNEEFPDRAEYFWAKSPGPPGPINGARPDEGEVSVDYQDIRFYIERGSDTFSVATEIPIRMVDPVINNNVAGLGDINVTTKAVLLDGRKWQLAQIFRSYFPTGSPIAGLGNGHTSLEPGVAYRYKFSDVTYLHGDLKFWFPLGGDPNQAGEILNYGIGFSHVAVDGDYFAVIPTLEFIAWTVLDGDQTLPGASPIMGAPPITERVDNLTIVNIAPGVRFVWENGNDCGTRELGISSGIAVSDAHWYESIVRVDLRWSF